MSENKKTRAILRLRGELLTKHGLTLVNFAQTEGFKLITVKKVIQRYWGTGEIPPRGVIARAILDRLQAYITGHAPPSSDIETVETENEQQEMAVTPEHHPEAQPRSSPPGQVKGKTARTRRRP